MGQIRTALACPAPTTWPDVALSAVFVLGAAAIIWAICWAVSR